MPFVGYVKKLNCTITSAEYKPNYSHVDYKVSAVFMSLICVKLTNKYATYNMSTHSNKLFDSFKTVPNSRCNVLLIYISQAHNVAYTNYSVAPLNKSKC